MGHPRAMRRVIGGLAAVLLAAVPCFGQVPVVNALSKVAGSRELAFGGAGVAIGADPTAVWTNPASLGGARGFCASMGAVRGAFGETTGQGLLAMRLAGGVAAVGVAYYDGGEVVLTAFDGTVRTVAGQRDMLGTLSYARTMLVGGALSLGASLKLLRTELFEESSATAPAGDLGAQLHLSRGFTIAFAIQNLGGDLRYDDATVRLPEEVRGGIMLSFLESENPFGLVLVSDLSQAVGGGGLALSEGAEVVASRHLVLRCGMRSSGVRELARHVVVAGLGVSLGRCRLDYSLQLFGGFAPPQTLMLTMAWPGAKPKAREGAGAVAPTPMEASRPSASQPVPAIEPPMPPEEEPQF